MGGEISGNWELGRVLMARTPRKRMTTEITMANTGRRRNLLNMFRCC
jgi:hypothetical protein